MEKRKLNKIKPKNKDPIPKNLEKTLLNLSSEIKDKIKREIKASFRDPEIMDFLLKNQSNHLTNFNKKTFTLFEKKVDKMFNTLNRIMKLHEIMDETLRNVLMAIRQNEYLQAWYPAQQGYPEMKVFGSHPIDAEKRKKERVNKHPG